MSDYVRANSKNYDGLNPSSGLLPDPAHIEVVDESRVFKMYNGNTQLTPAENSGAATLKSNDAVDSIRSDDNEALSSLTVAILLKKKGNMDKARKLFRHALALSPKHPKILNNYGEFLEETDGDYLKADHFYVRAITFSQRGSDEHLRALANRQRTQVIYNSYAVTF